MGDFNPRSREGSDHTILGALKPLMISIHAPARGATIALSSASPMASISIHAPARGATAGKCEEEQTNGYFNPRSREGSDTYKDTLVSYATGLFQSTLPRGERPAWLLRLRNWTTFQSTLPRGERQPRRIEELLRKEFQSTLPRGERPCRSDRKRQFSKFQSTLPRGERLVTSHSQLFFR